MLQTIQSLRQLLHSDLIQYVIEPYLRSEVFVIRPSLSFRSGRFQANFNLWTFQCSSDRKELDRGAKLIHNLQITDNLAQLVRSPLVKNGRFYYQGREGGIQSIDLRTGREGPVRFSSDTNQQLYVFPEYGCLRQSEAGYPRSLDQFWTGTVIDFEPQDLPGSDACNTYSIVCSPTKIYMAGLYSFSSWGCRPSQPNKHAITVYDRRGRHLEHYVGRTSAVERLFFAASGARLFVVETYPVGGVLKSTLTIREYGVIQWEGDCRGKVISVAVDDWNQALYIMYGDGIEILNFWGKRLGFRPGRFFGDQSLLVNKI